jgi:hypothetical protein
MIIKAIIVAMLAVFFLLIVYCKNEYFIYYKNLFKEICLKKIKKKETNGEW